MKVWVGWLAGIAWAGTSVPGAHAQQARAAVQMVRVSPDTVELGDPFTLRANVYVPPGRDLRLPATLPAEWGVESLARVRTESVEAGDGSVQVVLEYDLIPFEIGLAATPQLEITSGEAAPGEDRVRVGDGPEGSGDPAVVGTGQTPENAQSAQYAEITENTENVVGSSAAERSLDRLVVAGRRVFVTSPVLLDDIARGLRPRPPADVVGSSWNLPAVLGASVLSLLLLGVGTVQTREWLAARAASAIRADAPPETPEVWRKRALDDLDLLLARGHHRAGRLRDFYEGASDVVREYVEHFDPAWNRSWTSTELMRDLSADAGWPEPDALERAMGRAEVAKFAGATGALEGAEAAAEHDWRAMRGWVEASEQAPVFARMQEAIAGELAGEAADDEAMSPGGEPGGPE